jgi:signal transduction histidine kinase
VAATGSDTSPGRGRRLPRLSRRVNLRLRLTLLSGACFLLGAAVVLAITYGLFAHSSASQSPAVPSPGAGLQVAGSTHPAGPAGTAGAASGSSASKRQVVTLEESFPGGTEIISSGSSQSQPLGAGGHQALPSDRVDFKRIASSLQNQLSVVVVKANKALATQRRHSLDSLLTWSGVALGVMAAVSMLLGWLLAGRALRPLRAMTARAREITEDNLQARLSAGTQEDELGDLAHTFDGVLARLERAFVAQERFVANASHELRTPVTLERALLETALANPDADASELRHTCERVLASTEQQQQMIEALLTLARSQGGTDVQASVDLADLTQDAITLRQQRLDGLTLATDLHPARVSGDPALLDRLVANLLDNAIGHNRAEDGWITVETNREADGSWLRVSNSGPDVPASMISEIFEPFRRMEGERTATATGVGLGLSIVRAVADVHGATIAAGPVEGGGLRVQVRF